MFTKRNILDWLVITVGVAIVSTSKGIMTDKKARKENVGGEILAFVW